MYAFAERKKQKPSWTQLKYAVLRNFGGLECVDPVSVFGQQFEGTPIYLNPKVNHEITTLIYILENHLEYLFYVYALLLPVERGFFLSKIHN